MASSYEGTGFAIMKSLVKKTFSRTMSNGEKQPFVSGNNISLRSGHCPRVSALQRAFHTVPFPFLFPDASLSSYHLYKPEETTRNGR